MLTIRNRLIPFGKQYGAINLFGVLFYKPGMTLTPQVLNHERIHTAQIRELLFVPFYLIYLAEWFIRIIACKGDIYKAYRSISFEEEAYCHGDDLNYLSTRRHFAQWR
ncbi:MAG: hypothetical protein K2I18_04170 [Paramuribaculum sp.]|nr:hypothetical protein [Paramuribaculum sp.]